MLFLLKQQRYWKSISLAIRFVLLTEAFSQMINNFFIPYNMYTICKLFSGTQRQCRAL